ncbi:MAG: glycosyltransferase family 39 protein [Thermodesulfobacteriota bacterium]|nr:glycosyltransferase family 39 protein [Thermodesulfobacteriota bacterium]
MPELLTKVGKDKHPPFYFLLVHYIVKIIGFSETGLRLLSVLAGFLSVIIFFQLVKFITDKDTAFWSTIIMAVSPFVALFARMARYYSLGMMLVLLSTLFCIKTLKSGGKKISFWLGYVLSSSLAIHTFYLTIFIIIVQNILLLIFWTKNKISIKIIRWWLISQLLIIILFFPWSYYAFTQLLNTGKSGLVAEVKSNVINMLFLFYSFSYGETIFPWNPFVIISLPFFLYLLIKGLYYLRSKKILLETLLYFSVPLILMVVLIQISSVYLPFFKIPSRMMFLSPFYFLILGAGMSKIPSLKKKIPILFIIFLTFFISHKNYFADKCFINPTYITPARDMAHFVNFHLEENDLIISDKDSLFHLYFSPQKSKEALHFFTLEDSLQIKEYLLRNRHKRVWLITLNRDRTLNLYPFGLLNFLNSNYKLKEYKGYLPQDPLFRMVKEKMMKRKAYKYRSEIRLFLR